MGEAKNSFICLIKIFSWAILRLNFKNDETNPKSRDHGQVRDPLWCFAKKNGEEDGGVSTRHLHLPLLRQGRIEEKGRRRLAWQRMQEDDRRRRLGPFHHGRRHRQKRHPSSSGDQGTSMILLQLGLNGFLGEFCREMLI